jgi:hypothetical protein
VRLRATRVSGVANARRPWTPAASAAASGGTETVIQLNGVYYRVHTFLTSGTLTVTRGGDVEYLIVGGGGGGGRYWAGGGGAGGLLTNVGGAPLALTAQSYPVVVGNGGSAQTSGSSNGATGGNGDNSSFVGLTAIGGGGGSGSIAGSLNGSPGGSGGGAGGSGSTGTGGAATSGQGNAGGNDVFTPGGAGGGGAGAAGQASVNSSTAGSGGAGLSSSITGSSVMYAGGGGGSNATPGNGGAGGGGSGATDSVAAGNGSPNTGGGGGGGSNPRGAGTGGSGIVIARYAISPWTPAALGSNVAVWLDAADANTVVLNGSNVSQWNDKSGNGSHATQSTSAQQPTYSATSFSGQPGITFDGSNDSLRTLTNVMRNTTHGVYWVWRRVGAGTGDTYRPSIAGHPTTAGADRGVLHFVKNNNNLGASYPYYFGGSNFSYDLGSGTAYASNVGYVQSFQSNTTGWGVWRNGALEGTTNGIGTPDSSINGYILGAQYTPARYSNIVMSEVVIVESTDTTTRQLVEGYLAWKWGLQTSLPAGHPYRNAPPTV